MIFSSDLFALVFLPLWLVAFALVARAAKPWINWLVVAASLVFYASWSPSALPFLLGSIAVNYACVQHLKRHRSSRIAVWLGVGANLALLFYFKYACFFGAALGLTTCDVAAAAKQLPLAISFFTFQQIAYLVDIKRSAEAGRNAPSLVDYSAFVTFFPHLIAGPLTRSNELLAPVEAKSYRLTATTIEAGLIVFLVGFLKKVFLADPLGKIADPIFNATRETTIDGLSAALGTLAFSLQIYFDFSGYSEMAIGLAIMVGIALPWNFATPYGAASVTDFWRRWHMTLSRILRDYLYIPLGGDRRGLARKNLNALITMVLGGLWHGANWTFLAWGALHGLYLVIANLYGASGARPLPRWLAIVLTNICVLLAWVFFRSESLPAAYNMLSSLVTPPSLGAAAKHLTAAASHFGIERLKPGTLVLATGIALAAAYAIAATVQTQRIYSAYTSVMGGYLPLRLVVAVLAAALLSVGLYLQSGRAVQFIYFNF